MEQEIRNIVQACGACAVGTVAAGAVGEDDGRIYDGWLAAGRHARMDYMLRNDAVRRDPRELLPGCRTVIATAFNVRTATHSPYIADYAQGVDYHFVLKERLGRAAEAITARYGGECRVVVDSAPMRERYWAVRAGLGYTGDNGLLIVPGFGSAVVLGFVLWTGEAAPVQPQAAATVTNSGTAGAVTNSGAAGAVTEAAAVEAAPLRGCLHCGRCKRACPGQALAGDGSVDARRCHSYLSIEHRGEFDDPQLKLRKVYGCDVCRRVCPLDVGPVTDIPEFEPVAEITGLSLEDMRQMGPGAFKRLTAHSPLARLRVQGLRRNAGNMLS